MTVKLVVLYTQPDDPEDFDQHYFGVHMPMCGALPGLLGTETGRLVAAVDGGERSFYRITELSFADQAALDAAFGSAEGKATAADYRQIAPPGSRMFLKVLDE